MMMLLLVLALLVGKSSLAENFLKFVPSQVKAGEVIAVEVLPSYHFELKAPQHCGTESPIASSPRKVSCRFLTSGKQEIALSVCDNAKTFCKPITVAVEVSAMTAKGSRPKVASENLQRAQDELKKKVIPGFEHMRPADLLALSASDRKPLFVLISTDWCPPCNVVKENLLSTPAFATATSQWRRIYVDGDSPASEEWAKIVPFQGYPTFILLNSDLKEVSRFTDSIQLADFIDWTNEAKVFIDRPITELSKSVYLRQKGSWMEKVKDVLNHRDGEREKIWYLRWAIATNSAELKNWTAADVPIAILPEFLRAELEGEKELPSEKSAIRLAQIARSAKNNKGFTSDVSQLCEVDKKACAEFEKDLVDRENWWSHQKFTSPVEKASALTEEFLTQSEIYELLGKGDLAKEMAEKCAEQAKIAVQYSPLKQPRAANMFLGRCLEKAGCFADVDKLYAGLIANYENEPTFQLRYANSLKRQKRYKEALIWAKKAVLSSYGYNWLSAVYVKAEVEIALKDASAALQSINGAISELDLRDANSIDQRWATRLRELEQKAAM